jgi:acetoin utilization protein AcuB
MLVGERMSRPVITVHPETTLEQALEVMQKERIRRLPVVNRRGELVGLIAERVILRALPSDATTLSVWESRDMVRKLTVNKYMTVDVVTVTEDTPIEIAACLMEDNQISGLPVLRGGSLVGFITSRDIFTTFLELMGARDTGVRLTAMVMRRPGVLMSISKAIYEAGGDVVALGTTAGDTSETVELMIKVAQVDKETLARWVAPFVDRIVDVRETTPSCT